jgi:hypothetical protein
MDPNTIYENIGLVLLALALMYALAQVTARLSGNLGLPKSYVMAGLTAASHALAR